MRNGTGSITSTASQGSCPRLPVHQGGGELAYVGRDWLEKNRENCADLFDIEKWDIVKDWYAQHLNYLRNIGDRKHPLCDFIAKKAFSSDDYRFEGMPDLREYDGIDLHKFMYDHMGCRFVVRGARLPKALSSGEDAPCRVCYAIGEGAHQEVAVARAVRGDHPPRTARRSKLIITWIATATKAIAE